MCVSLWFVGFDVDNEILKCKYEVEVEVEVEKVKVKWM